MHLSKVKPSRGYYWKLEVKTSKPPIESKHPTMVYSRLQLNSVASLGGRKSHLRATVSPWFQEGRALLCERKHACSPWLGVMIRAWGHRLRLPRGPWAGQHTSVTVLQVLWSSQYFVLRPPHSCCGQLHSYSSLGVSSMKPSCFWSILTSVAHTFAFHTSFITLCSVVASILISIWIYCICFLIISM